MEEGALREGPPEGGASEPATRPFLPHWGPGGAGGQWEGLGEATGPCRAKGQPTHPFLGSFPGPMGPDPTLGPQSNHWGVMGLCAQGEQPAPGQCGSRKV